jgi:hypothetical protein
MKMRKFLHVLAVMLSSLAAMATHGKAESTGKEKRGEGELAKHHRHHTRVSRTAGEASLADPPRHHKSIASSSEPQDLKNSKHAAAWVSYVDQEDGIDQPPARLDPSLMASAERPLPPLTSIVPDGAAPPPLPGDQQSRYPWKRQIVTTTFWIGETPAANNRVPNTASCWDSHWAQNYGGSDTPDTTQRTAEYIPAGFSPNQNPFYIALPYNDMERGNHKAEAPQVIPWFAKEYKGPGQSVCKGRWIAIRFGSKVCYAQWEDAGPFRTDHWQYVFGDDRPRWNLNRGAGLDVSPAVRDYLGMNSTDVTDWKFVDFEEVPGGPWAKFGENNTFVQNARKSGGQMASVTVGPAAQNFESIVPNMQSPTVELR